MKQLQVFNFGSSQVRTIEKDGQPWFVLKDVCDVLELRSPDVRQRLNDDVVSTHTVPDSLGRSNTASIINEDGLYDVILESRKPEAKAFRKWVTSEVLPSIRKHGVYATVETAERMMNDPDFMIKVFTELKKEKEARVELEQKVEADKHKTLFADAVQTSNDCILVGQLATLLKQNGVNIGQTRLFNYLREQGYLCKSGERKNLPTQRAMELKLFEVKEFTVHGNTGIRVKHTPKVTGRGQIYFLNKFLNTAS